MRIQYSVALLGLTALLPVISMPAQIADPTKDPHTLHGIVQADDGSALANARLTLSRAGEAARLFETGEDGRFSFPGVRPGPVMLRVRRLGYKESSMNIAVDETTYSKSYAMKLEEAPSEVTSVIVEGSKGHLQEYYARKASNNFAFFFDRDDIQKRNPFYLSEMVGTVSGARLSSTGAGNRILLRGCQPMVWVDGMRAPGAELDEVARPGDIAAMEVYPSNAGLPAEYQDRSNRMCGAIIVWTKNR